VGLCGRRKTIEMMEEEKRNKVGGRLRLGLISFVFSSFVPTVAEKIPPSES
jgi:hypothetical protein